MKVRTTFRKRLPESHCLPHIVFEICDSCNWYAPQPAEGHIGLVRDVLAVYGSKVSGGGRRKGEAILTEQDKSAVRIFGNG